MPTVMVFPQAAVCLECGCAEFTIEENELRRLAEGIEAQDTPVLKQPGWNYGQRQMKSQ